MSRTVQCLKLKKEAQGLEFPPYPGELGTRIWQSISQQAWKDWMDVQTRLVNENRLNLADARAQIPEGTDGKVPVRRRRYRSARLRATQRLNMRRSPR